MMFQALLVVALLACSQAVPLSSRSAYQVSEAANQLGFNLYKQIAQEQRGNVVVSPWSAQTLFALAYMGADGYTAKEMAHALQLQNNKPEILRGFQEILRHWNVTKDTSAILSNVNRVYPAENAQVKDQYIREAKQALNASVEPIDYTNSEEAARKINKHIQQETVDQIQHLIQPDTLTPMTRLVFVNAMYFKGQWAHPFEVSEQQMNFHRSQSDARQVPSMKIRAILPYGYSEELNAHVVQLQYNDTDYSLLLIVPQEQEGLKQIEQNLPINVPQILSQMENRNVEVHMPKFHVSQKIDLVQTMQKLGMRDAFTNKANFQGIAQEQTQINKAIQSTHIDVDEHRVTAATTETVHSNEMIMSAPIQVTADKPFMFVLYKRSANAALMVGRVSEPVEQRREQGQHWEHSREQRQHWEQSREQGQH